MKKLEECKEYFKDLFTDCLVENSFEKSIFESTEKARFEIFCETMEFVYGDGFNRSRPSWAQESLNDFFRKNQPERCTAVRVRRRLYQKIKRKVKNVKV